MDLINKLLWWLGIQTTIPGYLVATIGVLILVVAVVLTLLILDIAEEARKANEDEEKLEDRFHDYF